MKNKIIITISFLFVVVLMQTIRSEAQQHPMFSHYMFNGLYINPAYAGSKEFVSTTFITNETDLYGSYAYHIQTNSGILSLGLSAGFSYFRSQFSDLTVWDPDDPVYETNSLSNVLPNFGAGLYYYSQKFYAGLSVPQILSYDEDQAFHIKIDKTHKVVRHYFLTSGMIVETRGELKLRPSMMIKYTSNTPIQYDLNLNFILSDIIWLGATYRSEDAIVLLAAYQVSKKLRIGYSYDMTLSDIRTYSSGSHEIIVGYDFGFNVLKMKTPRYF